MSKRYMIHEYIYDNVADSYTAIKGQIKAMVVADDPWTACSANGFGDANRYFAEEVHTDQLKGYKKSIGEEKKLLGELEAQIDKWTGEEIEKSKVCPNCEKQLNDNGECECGFGRDEIAVNGNVITKKDWEKVEKAIKKASKKKKPAKK